MTAALDLTAGEVSSLEFKKTRWHEWIELEALDLDDCEIECNGMSWAFSRQMSQKGIEHECMAGYVTRKHTCEAVVPHYWIELPGGWILDLRLRMWLGDTDQVPHGVFHRSHAASLGIQYTGEPEDRSGVEYTLPFLDALTYGMIHDVEFSHPDEV